MSFQNVYTQLRNKSALKAARATVLRINHLEARTEVLSSEELRTRFLALALQPAAARLEDAFALVRESARRTLGLRHFDVQLVGGCLLAQGKLAEMRTGEGKTLTLTAPAALWALERQGVHVVTANSYLAQRDAELMRPVYEALGLTVGAIHEAQSTAEKQAAYACDVTYGVGSEFGFDYLKDHLTADATTRVQRGHFAAIVDEVDSILIDEARVPMIISDHAADVGDLVTTLDACVRELTPGLHYEVDVKDKNAQLTDVGYAVVEAALVAANVITQPDALYDAAHLPWVRRLHAAVKAYALYRKDRDYVVDQGELVLVDTGTGRKMAGRRLEDGLHEALEARERIAIQRGSVTKATITYQNFFALYTRLAGLTGTALTEAEEFSSIYGLETVVVPTNKPIARHDAEDLVYLTKQQKFNAIVAKVAERHAAGQPVLLGCSTIRDADVLDQLLTEAGIPHETLTAKQIAREAHIIANAGRVGAVTIATNMAGRGTDIMLGGEKPAPTAFAEEADYLTAKAAWEAQRAQVAQSGGLFVLGSERNGIRRVDNQLAGRSGRQGDPGQVQFMMSLEDELLKVFSQGRQLALVRKMLEASGSALGGRTIGRLVASAQARVENQGFSARKNLMQFDSVLSDQRLAVYRLRDSLLTAGAQEHLEACVREALTRWGQEHFAGASPAALPVADMKQALLEEFGLNVPLLGWVSKGELTCEQMAQKIVDLGLAQLHETLPEEADARRMLFDVLDSAWTRHLTALEELRQNVQLKSKTGLNPVYQYHGDAFELFKGFQASVDHALAALVLSSQKRDAREAEQAARRARQDGFSRVALTLEKRWITRNEPCPCGSGERFRLCHGKLTA